MQPQLETKTPLTLEERVAKLEETLHKVLTLAEAHPLGKQLLKMLGL